MFPVVHAHARRRILGTRVERVPTHHKGGSENFATWWSISRRSSKRWSRGSVPTSSDPGLFRRPLAGPGNFLPIPGGPGPSVADLPVPVLIDHGERVGEPRALQRQPSDPNRNEGASAHLGLHPLSVQQDNEQVHQHQQPDGHSQIPRDEREHRVHGNFQESSTQWRAVQRPTTGLVSFPSPGEDGAVSCGLHGKGNVRAKPKRVTSQGTGLGPPARTLPRIFWNRNQNFLIVVGGLRFHPVPVPNPGDLPDPGDPPTPSARLRLRETQTPSADSQAETGPYFYLTRNGEQAGPFSRSQLDSMLRASEADPEELAWTEGMPNWRPLRELFVGVDDSENPPALPPPVNLSAPRVDESFWPQLWGSLSYPFGGNGAILMVAGTLFFAFLGVMTRFGTIFGWIPYLLASGFFLATLQGVVQSTGAGESSPPTWPDINNWVEDIIGPCLKWMLSLAMAFGPAIFCFWMAFAMERDFSLSVEFESRQQALWFGRRQ